MARRDRRRFSREFKVEAVRQITEEGRRPAEVCRELDLHPNLLGRWRAALEAEGEEAFPGEGRMKPLEEENRLLRQQVKRLQEERAILKKAVAIFSEPRR